VTIEVGVLRRILKQVKLWHLVRKDYKPLPEPKDIDRALSPEQELELLAVAGSRGERNVASDSLLAANTTAGGCEIRNLRLEDVDIEARRLHVRVGKNRRNQPKPVNRPSWLEHYSHIRQAA
jgi:integrase